MRKRKKYRNCTKAKNREKMWMMYMIRRGKILTLCYQRELDEQLQISIEKKEKKKTEQEWPTSYLETLTSGDQTEGIQNSWRICRKVRKVIHRGVPILSRVFLEAQLPFMHSLRVVLRKKICIIYIW